jgi:hypothetical protein
MTATATVLPDGSVTVVDGGMTFPPLSPAAVQAVAGKAQASADAGKTQQLTEGLILLAGMLAEVGDTGAATVTVQSGSATATVDQASFALAVERFPGAFNTSGQWVSGPMTVGQVPRTVTDGATASDETVTSVSAAFNSYDQGRAIAGGSLPSGTTITAVVDPQTVTVSQPATATATGVTLTIG